ncbi:MAG: thioredoxin-dependent thiol peroxidase [Alicyclobacillus sp.]|nr:thioredoxin-dependent thiol peroxidase [Alicyclobacillus sp.]
MMEVGQTAPDFTLPTQQGGTVHLRELRGHIVVLYFYPRDNTPGCTKEACAFRDLAAEFAAAGAVILGVSRDSVASHEKFARKFDLPMPLLADVDGSVCESYGVLQEKHLYGRTHIGIVRTTFLIDADGIVRKVYPKVKVEGHADAVLADVRTLQGDRA